MPKYAVELHDGRKFEIEADAPPTEQDVMEALGGHGNAPPGSLSRYVNGAWENLNPITAAKGLVNAVAHPIDTGAAILKSQGSQFSKAADDYSKGHYSEMIGHGAAGLLPLVGPAAASAGERIGQGDVAGGLGEGSGLIASLLLAPKSGGVTKDLAEGAQGGLSSAAERIVNSNVKPPPSLVARNPAINIPRVILDERLSPGFKGAHQGKLISKSLADEVTNLAATDSATGAKYSLDPLSRGLDDLIDKYKKNPAGESDVAAVQGAKDELYNHPLYSKDKFATQMVPTQSPILDANGKPIIQMTPQQVKVGRELIDQDASTINDMKRGIYEENPKAYGERKGARVQAEKAEAREAKGILDTNVSGIQDVNERNAGIITARKALNKMGVREANKYPVGLIDLLAGVPAASAAYLSNPAVAAFLGLPIALKHPMTAFPIARGLDAVGQAGKIAPALGHTVTTAMRVGNPLNKARVDSLYDAYLASQK